MPHPANAATDVISSQAAVNRRLRQLGIVHSWMIDAVQQGNVARRFAHPLGLPGSNAYLAVNQALAVLRELTIPYGWFPDTYLGIPVAMSPDRDLAITVTEGDQATGTDGGFEPSTRALKGPNTSRAAERNVLFEDTPVSFFILLTHASDDEQELRAELSSPSYTLDGRVHGWGERIILGDVLPPGPSSRLVKEPAPAAPAPPVTVTRKTS